MEENKAAASPSSDAATINKINLPDSGVENKSDTKKMRKETYGEFYATWPETDAKYYYTKEKASDCIVDVFRGDELLFQKQRNSYRVNNVDGFIIKFVPNVSDPTSKEPLILFNSKHAQIDILNVKGDLINSYKLGDFIDEIHIFGDWIILVEWVWHPFWMISINTLKEFLDNSRKSYGFYMEEYGDGLNQMEFSEQGLTINIGKQEQECVSWDKFMADRLRIDFYDGKIVKTSSKVVKASNADD